MQRTVTLKPVPVPNVPVDCRRCGDSGFLDLSKPCMECAKGIEWAAYIALQGNPPPCGCGKPAEYTLLSTPRCRQCDYRHNTKAKGKGRAAYQQTDKANWSRAEQIATEGNSHGS
jgi:hypothetical protein